MAGGGDLAPDRGSHSGADKSSESEDLGNHCCVKRVMGGFVNESGCGCGCVVLV